MRACLPGRRAAVGPSSPVRARAPDNNLTELPSELAELPRLRSVEVGGNPLDVGAAAESLGAEVEEADGGTRLVLRRA